jgi:hypothetical protein
MHIGNSSKLKIIDIANYDRRIVHLALAKAYFDQQSIDKPPTKNLAYVAIVPNATSVS